MPQTTIALIIIQMPTSSRWMPPTRWPAKLRGYASFVPFAIYLCWVPKGLREGWLSSNDSSNNAMDNSLHWRWAVTFFVNILPYFGHVLMTSTFCLLGLPTLCLVACLCTQNFSGAKRILAYLARSGANNASQMLSLPSSSLCQHPLSLSSLSAASDRAPKISLQLLLNFYSTEEHFLANFFGSKIHEHRWFCWPGIRSRMAVFSSTMYGQTSWDLVVNNLNVFADVLLELFFGPSAIRGKDSPVKF